MARPLRGRPGAKSALHFSCFVGVPCIEQSVARQQILELGICSAVVEEGGDLPVGLWQVLAGEVLGQSPAKPKIILARQRDVDRGIVWIRGRVPIEFPRRPSAPYGPAFLAKRCSVSGADEGERRAGRPCCPAVRGRRGGFDRSPNPLY